MAYIGTSPSNGVRRKHTYTATASQTTFSGAGAEGAVLSYKDSNYVDVYVNGVKLGDADYTATSGTSIVLAVGAAVNDIVEIIVYDVFSVADTVSKADGGTFDGNVTMAGTLAVTGETTLATHLNMGDGDFIKLGDSGEFVIYHTSSGNSTIAETGGGDLNIDGTNLYLRNSTAFGEYYLSAVSDGAVTLYHNNNSKLATTSTGIDVTGTAVTDGLTVAGNMSVDGGSVKLDGNYPTGTDNVALGNAVLNGSLTGGYNTAMGATAMTALTSGSLNVGIGRVALGSLTSGSYNTGVGANALYANTTASNNTAVGYNALTANTTGSQNVGIGDGSLSANTTASNNVSVGYFSMDSNTTGTQNVAVGASALRYNTTTSSNTAVGYQALNANTAHNNTAVGWYAARTNTSGTALTAIGLQALDQNTTGSNNTAVGQEALKANTTGDSNTAIGLVAMVANTTGNYNVAMGRQALDANTGGSNSTALGYASLTSVTGTGDRNNCAVGFQSGQNATTASELVLMGKNAGRYITTGDSNVVLGNEAGAGLRGSAVTTGASNILIGRQVDVNSAGDSYCGVIGVHSVGKGGGTGYLDFNGGSIYQGNNSSSWATTSDRRIKKNIVDNNVGLDAINQVQVRNFEYRTKDEITELPTHSAINKQGVQLGVIAQEIQTVLPDMVKEESTGVLSVNPDNMTWYLVNAVKELSAQVTALQAEVATLKGE